MELPVEPRSHGLDIARGTAVILMVVYHMCEYSHTPTNRWLLAACFALTAFRMPVLFLISGYLSASLTRKPKRQALARITNLAWLYLLWLPVMVIVSPSLKRAGVGDILENVWKPSTELWFIWSLALLMVSLFAVSALPRRTVLLASLLIAITDYSGVFGLSFGHDNLLRYAPMFYVGALYREELKSLINARFSIGLAVAIVAGVSLVHLLSEYARQSQGWQILGPFERICVCLAAIYFLKPIELMPRFAGWLGMVGQKTLPIYLVHLPLWVVINPILPKIGGIFTPMFSAGCLIIVSLAVHRASRRAKFAWLFVQPRWWSEGIAQAAWKVDRRYVAR